MRGRRVTYRGALRRSLAPLVVVLQALSAMPIMAKYANRLPGLSSVTPGGGSTSSDGSGPFVVPLSETHHSELDESGWLPSTPNRVELERNNSLLVLGESGSGKTTTIELLMHQMNSDSDEPVVIFDFKGEFGDTDIFQNREVKTVSVRDPDWKWNVFREVERESDYEEIATKLVDTHNDSGRNEFFTEAAQRVLNGVLIHLDRENREPTNRELVQFFNQTQGEIYEALSSHEDLRTAAEQIGGPDDKTGQDILSTLRPFVDKVFTGAFGDVGGFSVRNYMRNPRGNVLVVQATISQFERTKPGLKFLIDWAIQLGLDDSSRNCYYVLDEFQRLPELQMIEMLVNAGRSKQAQAILGVQGVTQLQSSYGEELARAITAGTTQKVMMRPGDKETTEMISNAIGSVIVEHRQDADGWGNKKVTQEKQEYLSEREIQQFKTGETVIRVPGGFVHGRVKPWDHLSADEQQKLRNN
jgi:type IV secretory pathway TraG/TraD family ATPase VirD4